MKRRELFRMGAGAAALGAVGYGLGTPAFAQAKQVFKASDVHPVGYPTVVAVEDMGKKLEAATNGRLSIQMYPSMQLGGEKEAIEQAQVGALQIARVSVGALGPVVDGAENNPPSFVFDNHYQVAKYFTLTEHLIVPEVLVFSRITWNKLSPADQALIRKLSREAQFDERKLWKLKEADAFARMKAANIEVDHIADKKPFQDAVKPVWDKYGAKYAELIKQIEAVH